MEQMEARHILLAAGVELELSDLQQQEKNWPEKEKCLEEQYFPAAIALALPRQLG